MPRKLVLDCSEANYTAAAFHITAAILVSLLTEFEPLLNDLFLFCKQ